MTENPQQPAREAPESDPGSGPSRLKAAFVGKPGRGQVLVAALLAVLGCAAAVQIQLTHDDEDFSGQRRQELVIILDGLASTIDRAETELAELERTRDDLLSSSVRRQAALDEASDRLDVLGILAGTLPAEGPGISITIDDPQASLRATTLLNGIQELRDAGAEAIEINDTVRVVASTWFIEEDGVIVIDGVELREPYTIDAIGSSHTLAEAVTFPGGFADGVEQDGASLQANELEVVEVGSLHTVEPPEYAQPTDD
jgi:uncharacterized protein YlxW (UPF0749 family)